MEQKIPNDQKMQWQDTFLRYRNGEFIVHFFSRKKVEPLAQGYEIVAVEAFEEGELHKKLYAVTLRKIR